MIQILFEGLVRTMREYVESKKKYFQKVENIQKNWEYSDIKKVNLFLKLKLNLILRKRNLLRNLPVMSTA